MGRHYTQLNIEDWCELARLHAAGRSLRQIAAALDRAPSTIARELKRNTSRQQGYRPQYAQEQARARRWGGARLDRDAALRAHFAQRTDVLVCGAGYLRQAAGNRAERLAPDCLVAFGVNPAAIVARNGYVIGEVGKPPDFVLEVASRSTGRRDNTVKRAGVHGVWRGGILAVRPHRGAVSRGSAGRGPAGERGIRTHRDQRGAGRANLGAQPGVGAEPVLGRGRSAILRPGGWSVSADTGRAGRTTRCRACGPLGC